LVAQLAATGAIDPELRALVTHKGLRE
jgi:hypothetical protein